MRGSRFVSAAAIGLFACAAAQEETTSAAMALAAKARLAGTVVASCPAEFRAGSPGAFAVAVENLPAAGRYVALEADGTATELGTFAGSADLSCYSRAEAGKLDATIRQSDGIHGSVTPRWNTTVVCGFVDDTEAVCWQYSPPDRGFVTVGGWVT